MHFQTLPLHTNRDLVDEGSVTPEVVPDIELRVTSVERINRNVRGLVALTDLEPGELIERAPVIMLSAESLPIVERTCIHKRLFEWDESQGLYGIALGGPSFVRHSDSHNSYFEWDPGEASLALYAARPIVRGEEIFIDYVNPDSPPSLEPGDSNHTVESFLPNRRLPSVGLDLAMPADIPGKGRGLVAAADVNPGKILTLGPALPIPREQEEDVNLIKELVDYPMGWGSSSASVAFALGKTSLVNHSYHPNAKYVVNHQLMTVGLQAIRAIRAGTEITMDYNVELDFEVME